MIETALAYASLYNFLAAAFGNPPTAEWLAVFAQVMPEVAPVSLAEWQRAYTQVLVGPGADYVPPYASLYLQPASNGKALLWGPEASLVEAIYGEAGLDIAPGQPRVPDHLALELQFMQHLCAREVDAEARGGTAEALDWRTRRHAFLREHVLTWLPLFAERMSNAGAQPLYRELTQFTIDCVHSELDGE
jgi:TorA maturation chaperone TorD